MLLLQCSRILLSSSLRMTLNSNLHKSSVLCTVTFKPVKVKHLNLNLNIFLKRNYIRYSTGGRLRREDGLPEGFELVYQARYKLLYLCYVCVCYFSLGLTSWYLIQSFVLNNDEANKTLKVFRIELTKGDPALTTSFIVSASIAAIALRCAFKTPRRMFMKDNEIIAVNYSFLGPYSKKFVKCLKQEIRPLAPIAAMPWRSMTYDFKGVRLYLIRANIRYFIPNAHLIGRNKPLRTRLNDFVDRVKELLQFVIRRKKVKS